VSGAALSQALEAIKALPMMKNLPQGVTVVPGGDAELQGELFDEFGTAISNGLMMVYVVLAILFASLLHPLTILFSLPLSITGAVLALLLTYQPITLPVIIGILMLLGIVTKNAIMLVDFAIESMHANADRTAAIIDAGEKRARPIVMTTIAMGAGMLPSALAFGAGGEFRSPMAIAVIGGLIVSTLLSLLFVPAFFTLMDDFGRLMARIFGRFIGGADEHPPGAAPKPSASDAHPPEHAAADHAGKGVEPTPEPAKAG
jgi:multidrug efflux pump subunit AcrB